MLLLRDKFRESSYIAKTTTTSNRSEGRGRWLPNVLLIHCLGKRCTAIGGLSPYCEVNGGFLILTIPMLITVIVPSSFI